MPGVITIISPSRSCTQTLSPKLRHRLSVTKCRLVNENRADFQLQGASRMLLLQSTHARSDLFKWTLARFVGSDLVGSDELGDRSHSLGVWRRENGFSNFL